jgi:hypothetical protein
MIRSLPSDLSMRHDRLASVSAAKVQMVLACQS